MLVFMFVWRVGLFSDSIFAPVSRRIRTSFTRILTTDNRIAAPTDFRDYSSELMGEDPPFRMI